ncbi:MAG: hypothetical protein ACI9NT_000879 [Bacteroidia bacterium]|jgi:hypothetical protein
MTVDTTFMKSSPSLLLVLLPLFLALPLLSGCGCGFDCNDDDDENLPATLSIGLSDSQPEDLAEVVIEIDSIILKRDNANKADVEINTFTVPELNAIDAETIQVNLLDYIGVTQVLVVENLEIEADFYDSIVINVIDGDENKSYVIEDETGTQKILTVDNSVLNLSGRQILSGENSITIEFELARALQYKAANDTYLLSTEGVRVVDTILSAQLVGKIDSSLFNTAAPCDEKADPEVGNRVYLYQGIGLDLEDLADVFSLESDNSAGKLAPYSVATLFNNAPANRWEYYFAYLPAGDYTLAFSCDTEEDGSVNYDALTIPLPSIQFVEISLSQSEQFECDLTEEEPNC